MKTRVLLILILFACGGILPLQAFYFPNEKLHYVITYKWGMVHKETAEATLSLNNSNDLVYLTMSASTKPWADKIFTVRDTLLCTLSRKDFRPIKYVKITHEGDTHSRVEVNFSYHGSVVGGKTVKKKFKSDGIQTKTASLTASGPTYDMLSIFYYIRTLDYNKLMNGNRAEATIFSGSKAEKATIRCVGKEIVTLHDKGKTRREAYHLKFRFTTHGGKKSSDDMDAWVSVESPHIPLRLSGKLPIGRLEVYLK